MGRGDGVLTRGANDVRSTREAVAKRSYWAYDIARERTQLSLHLKAVGLTMQPGGFYKITYEALPDGIGGFEPIGFFVARYDGSRYELMGDSGCQRFPQYNDPPNVSRSHHKSRIRRPKSTRHRNPGGMR